MGRRNVESIGLVVCSWKRKLEVEQGRGNEEYGCSIPARLRVEDSGLRV